MSKFRNNEERSPKTVPVSKLTGKVPTSHDSLRAVAKDIDDSYDGPPAHWPTSGHKETND